MTKISPGCFTFIIIGIFLLMLLCIGVFGKTVMLEITKSIEEDVEIIYVFCDTTTCEVIEGADGFAYISTPDGVYKLYEEGNLVDFVKGNRILKQKYVDRQCYRLDNNYESARLVGESFCRDQYNYPEEWR